MAPDPLRPASRRFFSIPRFQAVLMLACLLIFSATQTTHVYAQNESFATQKKDYLHARELLKQKKFSQYRKFRASHEKHILFPINEYRYLKANLKNISEESVTAFIHDNHYAGVSHDLRQHWLHFLANKKSWPKFLKYHAEPVRDLSLKCHHLNALLQTGVKLEIIDLEIETIWLSGKSLPNACDSVFLTWKKGGLLSQDRVWSRLGLAIKKGNEPLARFLSKTYLDSNGQQWAQRWITMRNNPEKALKSVDYETSHSRAGEIIAYGFNRLAFRDANAASTLWRRQEKEFSLDKTSVINVYDRIGLHAALQHLPNSYDLFAYKPVDEDAQVWRVRAALRDQRWLDVLTAIDDLPEKHVESLEWQYWRARALAALEKNEEANIIFEALSSKRNYYGFLSADRLQQPLAMNDKTATTNANTLAEMITMPGIRMAHALLKAGEVSNARRQWRWATRKFKPDQLISAAVLAQGWDWANPVITAMTNAGNLDDLNLRFPLKHKKTVLHFSERNQIDPSWAFGVIRQESAFMADAKSSAGALGLMQLMPYTAKRVGKRLGVKVGNKWSILKIEKNIQLGTTYLRMVLDRLGQHPVLATAAYNAGPHRVERWLPKHQSLPADIWIETIPFRETRRYVKNVLAFSMIYDYRRGVQSRPLSSFLLDVPAANKLVTNDGG